MAPIRKMTSGFSSLLSRGTSYLTGTRQDGSEFSTAPAGSLFEKVDPSVDGEECLHDCDTCTIKYPAKFSIDEEAKLYGHIKGWATHLLVATGKTDWVRDVADEKGSVMEAVEKNAPPKNGRLMLSASNIPVPHHNSNPYAEPTRALLLPAFTWIEGLAPDTVPELITHVVNAAPTSTSPLKSLVSATSEPSSTAEHTLTSSDPSSVTIPTSLPFTTKACEHDAVILMCSQRTRDARCGQSAPLLKREFERHLRPLGLYRDMQDHRPGGVGVYFISHTGGHKFSANVMVYRRKGMGKKLINGGGGMMVKNGKANDGKEEEQDGGAAQCIWLARVKPDECEGIVKYTVLQGKVVKPERQLRGGFDREKSLCSW